MLAYFRLQHEQNRRTQSFIKAFLSKKLTLTVLPFPEPGTSRCFWEPYRCIIYQPFSQALLLFCILPKCYCPISVLDKCPFLASRTIFSIGTVWVRQHKDKPACCSSRKAPTMLEKQTELKFFVYEVLWSVGLSLLVQSPFLSWRSWQETKVIQWLKVPPKIWLVCLEERNGHCYKWSTNF